MFCFNELNHQKAALEIKKYPVGKEKSAIMALLWLAQEQDGQNILTKEKIDYIAHFLSIPIIKVYEVASFYTMYNLTDVGKNHIQICGTVPCHLVGAKDLLEICKKVLGVDKDQVTSDGKISFTEVECLGACTHAPVMQVNNQKYYEKVDKSVMTGVINSLLNQSI